MTLDSGLLSWATLYNSCVELFATECELQYPIRSFKYHIINVDFTSFKGCITSVIFLFF